MSARPVVVPEHQMVEEKPVGFPASTVAFWCVIEKNRTSPGTRPEGVLQVIVVALFTDVADVGVTGMVIAMTTQAASGARLTLAEVSVRVSPFATAFEAVSAAEKMKVPAEEAS